MVSIPRRRSTRAALVGAAAVLIAAPMIGVAMADEAPGSTAVAAQQLEDGFEGDNAAWTVTGEKPGSAYLRFDTSAGAARTGDNLMYLTNLDSGRLMASRAFTLKTVGATNDP